MTARTYTRVPPRLTVSRKSQAIRASACDRRKSAQVLEDRSGAIDTGVAEDLPDRRRRDLHAQHEQFSVQTSVTPTGVLLRQTQHQDADGSQRAWPAGTLGPGLEGVATGDEVAVPA